LQIYEQSTIGKSRASGKQIANRFIFYAKSAFQTEFIRTLLWIITHLILAVPPDF
jgi:hypothetical protein